MGRSSGTYTAPANSFNPAVGATTIDTVAWNAILDDLETALTESMARDGQTTTTAVIPFASGVKTDTVVEKTSNTGVTIDSVLLKDAGIQLGTSGTLIFEGSTADGNETTLTVTDPTADRTITIPDATATLAITNANNDFTADQSINKTSSVATLNIKRSDTHGDGVVVGQVVGIGKDSGAAAQNYAIITFNAVLDDAGSEDGSLAFDTTQGGTGAVRMTIGGAVSGGGMYMAGATGTDKGPGTINGTAIYDDGVLLANTVQANQAALEAETDENTYVPPDLVKHSPGVAKAWGKVTYSSGVPSLVSGSHNIASIADTNTGVCTVTIADDFSGTGYAIQVTNFEPGAASQMDAPAVTAQAAGTFELTTYNGGSVADPADTNGWFFVCFGDQ